MEHTRLLVATIIVVGLVLTVLAVKIDDVYVAWVAGASTVGGVLGVWR